MVQYSFRFYRDIWWNLTRQVKQPQLKPPSQATIDGTEIALEKHILPMLGNYSIDFLNQ